MIFIFFSFRCLFYKETTGANTKRKLFRIFGIWRFGNKSYRSIIKVSEVFERNFPFFMTH